MDKAVKISEAFRSRDVCSLGLWEQGAWRLKAYVIAYAQVPVDDRLIAAARTLVIDELDGLAEGSTHYNVGFIGIHQGKTSNFVFIDWWADENELHHHVYVSELEHPLALRDMTQTGLTACVWDLELMAFERDAWVEHVLKKPDAPDIEGYLAARIRSPVTAV